jgi:hypothetical protein
MSDLNSWEDDPAAQEENLSRQAQQMNLNNNPQQGGSFRPGASSFQPGAQSFQPGQNFQQYGGGYEQPGYQNYYNTQAGQGYGYPQYGQQGGYNQFPQGGYNAGYNQGGYNQTYGESLTQSHKSRLPRSVALTSFVQIFADMAHLCRTTIPWLRTTTASRVHHFTTSPSSNSYNCKTTGGWLFRFCWIEQTHHDKGWSSKGS